MAKYPSISSDPYIQGRYVSMRRNGESHMISEMLALQSAPRAKTDDTYFKIAFDGRQQTLGEQFKGDEKVLDHVVKTAREHGYEPQYTDFYASGLAEFPGDPKAFIPASGGRGHIRRVCEERNMACHGAVNVKRRELENPPEKVTGLAEDLVQERVDAAIKADPSKAENLPGLREEIIEKHGAK